MKRTAALDNASLTEAFQRSPIGDKFFADNSNEQKRAHLYAGAAGRKIATRKLPTGGFKVTMIE